VLSLKAAWRSERRRCSWSSVNGVGLRFKAHVRLLWVARRRSEPVRAVHNHGGCARDGRIFVRLRHRRCERRAVPRLLKVSGVGPKIGWGSVIVLQCRGFPLGAHIEVQRMSRCSRAFGHRPARTAERVISRDARRKRQKLVDAAKPAERRRRQEMGRTKAATLACDFRKAEEALQRPGLPPLADNQVPPRAGSGPAGEDRSTNRTFQTRRNHTGSRCKRPASLKNLHGI